ncbi:MAG: MGMT family protein [Acidimicrobiia bacterium]|nr:MGMT family protein [Acidimicrobiia bacterium]
MKDFGEEVARVLEQLEPGEVVSYGEVAEEAGFPGAARAVGNLVRSTPGLPWWRVVAKSGRLAPGLEQRQTELLRSEGVAVNNGRVRLRDNTRPESEGS